MTRDELKDIADYDHDRSVDEDFEAAEYDEYDRRLGDLTRAIAESYRARAVYIRSRLDEK
jgi:hypothetical protein